MVNRVRGETEISVNGEPRRLLLTLGALAEIEGDLGQPMGKIEEIMKDGRIAPVSTIVYWMLRAGGWDDLKKSDMLKLNFDFRDALEAFKSAMGGMTAEEPAEGNAPASQGKTS